MAQRYAEDCRGLVHNSAAGRSTRRFGSCGENIFISTHKVIFNIYDNIDNITQGALDFRH